MVGRLFDASGRPPLFSPFIDIEEDVARVKSAIPVGTQFSPDLIDLPEFLTAICRSSGDKKAMEAAIWKPPVRVATKRGNPTRRVSSLPLESAKQYGLLEGDDYTATDLARRLSGLSGQQVYDEFARHVLLNRGGLRVVEAAQQMALDEPESGVSITGDSLAAYLTDQGFTVIVHNTAINSLRLWLARAGVFGPSDWKVNPDAKARLVGLSDTEIAALVGLSEEQREFALALCRIHPDGPYQAATVRDNAERSLGRRLDRSSLPLLMEPLKTAGFIDYSSGGTRGGKSAEVWLLPKFHAEILEPFLRDATGQLDSALTEYYKRDLTQIYADLDSPDTYVKGLALEAYAIQIMRRLGLRFVRWRERAKDHTGQAEVDAILSGEQFGTPTRWQVQCKNTPSGQVRLDAVAKEVGLLPLTKATHILILANCPFSRDARVFASEVMRHAPVAIFLLDRDDFEAIRSTKGGALARILLEKSREIAALKRPGLDWLTGSRSS